jgi:hypothetical protein
MSMEKRAPYGKPLRQAHSFLIGYWNFIITNVSIIYIRRVFVVNLYFKVYKDPKMNMAF